ncbi:hypothetical protein DENSPDRAFT_361892 [Dentipellis sp. KUC8613]|nr:hypothetical protein DENSPDRAFT_361892 [Dentipellis sp. KUC8613]
MYAYCRFWHLFRSYCFLYGSLHWHSAPRIRLWYFLLASTPSLYACAPLLPFVSLVSLVPVLSAVLRTAVELIAYISFLCTRLVFCFPFGPSRLFPRPLHEQGSPAPHPRVFMCFISFRSYVWNCNAASIYRSSLPSLHNRMSKISRTVYNPRPNAILINDTSRSNFVPTPAYASSVRHVPVGAFHYPAAGARNTDRRLRGAKPLHRTYLAGAICPAL